MGKLLENNIAKKIIYISTLLLLICNTSFAQNLTTIQGVVKDSVTRQPIPFVTVQFDKTTIGSFSDEDGHFKLSNRNNITSVTISFLGYLPYKLTIPRGTVTNKEILLKPESRQLGEVVVKPKKEKYSKKNNPAVELIKKVIAHKKQNNITAQDYYQFNEYDRILFALNDFKPEQSQFKRYKFLPNYMDTSIIDSKPILPFSVRETYAENYYRKNPKSNKRIVKAYKIAGVDEVIETDGLDAIIKEVFKDINIFDNNISLMFHDFISPLSEHSSVNFYRWYLSDTVNIENDRFVKLDFAPFNSRDIGFTGTLFISTDSSFAVKRAILRAPKKMNINFVDEMIIHQEFKQVGHHQWIPQEQRMAIDMSMVQAVKFYVDKTRTYSDFTFNQKMDAIHLLNAPEVFEKDYEDRSKEYWDKIRVANSSKDYKMDKLVTEMKDVFLFKLIFDVGKVVSSGYIPLSKDEDKNKLDIGTVRTFYSYNSVEGNRFRLTLATTKNFHPHLYLYGYGAYGTRDNKFKYYGEATWTFNKVRKHKDEFPRNNLTVAYKYDMNNLGQRYTQAERDNILMSLKSSKNEKMTYNRQSQISYEREFYNGFSFKLSGQTFDERPAGNLVFEKMDEFGQIYPVEKIQTTETILALRYAPNEKFFQQRRKRYSMPSKKFVINMSHTTAWENVLGGQYNYNKTSFSIRKDLWVAPYGKFMLTAQAEKIWGEAPFPFLITPSANNSYTIQNGSFYLIEPLEFAHDAQVSWEIYYHMGGWLFNRIPLLKALKWREVFGFRGFLGELGKRNNPLTNRDLLVLPQKTFTTQKGKPYMEYNIGIENIFKLFRIDYVRRINYLDHPDINKDGFRLTFDLNF